MINQRGSGKHRRVGFVAFALGNALDKHIVVRGAMLPFAAFRAIRFIGREVARVLVMHVLVSVCLKLVRTLGGGGRYSIVMWM